MASSSEDTGALTEEEHPQAPPMPNPEPSETAPGEAEEEPQTLEWAQELLDRGSKAIEGKDFVEAVDCLSQALEIRCGFILQSLNLLHDLGPVSRMHLLHEVAIRNL